MKVVINTCYGGFGLSKAAFARWRAAKNLSDHDQSYQYDSDISRNDAELIQIVEEMGRAAHGDFASLKIVEVPDGVDWYIDEYDGREWVAERHRTWE